MAEDKAPPEPGIPCEQEVYMTPAQASEYLSIPKATLYGWRTRRPGFGPPAIKVGGILRYRRRDLDDWMSEHREDIPAEVPRRSTRGTASPVPSITRKSKPRRPGAN